MSNKTVWWIVGIVVLVVVVGLAIYMRDGDQEGIANQAGDQTDTVPGENATSTATSSNDGTATPAKLAYTAAVKKYGNNRIQFDTDCSTEQNKVTFKAGTDVMFDNRAPVSRTIRFGGTSYTIAKYDYRIIKMTAQSYPAVIGVDCDKQQNVTTVTIQR